MLCECRSDDFTIMDIATPLNAQFSAFYKRSFAYYTIKERLPRILTQTIDVLVRHREAIIGEYGEDSSAEIKHAIAELSKLRYEIMTNKPMRNIESNAPDVKIYNRVLAEESKPLYFTTSFLNAECYMYRRIREIFELSENLQEYDQFRIQKQEAFFTALEPMANLSKHLLAILNSTQGEGSETVKEHFIKMLKLNLWGNKCDLSLSNGVIENTQNPFETLVQYQANILCDDSEQVWKSISSTDTDSQIIDIIYDNAGYELFSDLCLADFIISKNLAKSVRMYVKSIPWFVSDVMTHDFHWTLEQLKSSSDNRSSLQEMGKRWSAYVKTGKWSIIENDFFTLPYDFSYMEHVRPELYAKLAEAKLIFVKGDLNYRKLFGERCWDPTTPCKEATSGFCPAPFCTLRTVKCDLVCGLRPNVCEELDAKDPKWKGTGDYGLIQFVEKVESQ